MEGTHESLCTGGNSSEDDNWLPVHVQVTEVEEGEGIYGDQRLVGNSETHRGKEDKFPVTDDCMPCNHSILDVLNCSEEGDKIDLSRDCPGEDDLKSERDMIRCKEQRVIEALRHTLEEKCSALQEREAQLEVMQRDRLELGASLRQVQREMAALKMKNGWLEKELAAKEREIQQLKLSGHIATDSINGTHSHTVSSMTWRQATDAPFSGKLGSATALGNLVCIRVAGSSDIHVCDTMTMEWFLTPPCPLDACSLVTVNNTLTVVGGRIDASVTNLLYSIHLKSFRAVKRQPWKDQFPAMLTKRMFAMAVSSANILAVAGGWNGHQALRTVEILRLDREFMQWSKVSSLPSPVYSASACICKGKLYVLGGFTQKGPTKAVLSASISLLLDSTKDGVWHRPTSLPTYRSTCVTFNDHLLSFGGENDNELERRVSTAVTINDNHLETGAVYEYNTSDGEWYRISEMPVSRCQSCVAVLGDRSEVMVMGGHSGPTGRTQTVQLATLEL